MFNSGIGEGIMKNRWHIRYQHKWKYDWGFDEALCNNDFID